MVAGCTLCVLKLTWVFVVVGSYKVAPRCLLPIGDKCKDDKAARENAESKPGGKKKPKKRPRLLLADPASHRAGPGDEEAGIMPMSPTAAALHNAAFERAGAVPPWGEGGVPSRAVVAASQVARHEASQGRRLETRGAAYAGTDRWLCCVGCLCPRSPLTTSLPLPLFRPIALHYRRCRVATADGAHSV